jgi:Ca-activated chloride channel family protein
MFFYGSGYMGRKIKWLVIRAEEEKDMKKLFAVCILLVLATMLAACSNREDVAMDSGNILPTSDGGYMWRGGEVGGEADGYELNGNDWFGVEDLVEWDDGGAQLQSEGIGVRAEVDAALSAPAVDMEMSRQTTGAGDPFGGERYIPIVDNAFVRPRDEAAVSFTMQMDTASYRNVARFINSGHRPPSDAVRVAEMVNYFNYDLVLPTDDSPFSIYTEIGPSPFNSDKHLAFVRVLAQDINRDDLPASNLTFLIDTSGSMAPANRLPLLQQSLALLVANLDERDTVSVVTYAGCARVLLDSVRGDRHEYIMDAINGLRASGGTAGGPGIMKAYELAAQNFNSDMNNRIILATDGDFNIGVSSTADLEKLMNEHRTRGIHMTLLGFGVGNYTSQTMETIAKNGNGAYHYIDTISAGRKVFVEELISNMYVIAEEVRAQIVFNPETVANYRLIGYENRLIENRHFDDDSRDHGQVGVGADLVIMFEIETTDAVRLRSAPQRLFTVRIRYHDPGATDSHLIEAPAFGFAPLENTTDFNFAAAVASFGHILRGSQFTGNATIPGVISLASDSVGVDTHGHRREFLELVHAYANLR